MAQPDEQVVGTINPDTERERAVQQGSAYTQNLTEQLGKTEFKPSAGVQRGSTNDRNYNKEPSADKIQVRARGSLTGLEQLGSKPVQLGGKNNAISFSRQSANKVQAQLAQLRGNQQARKETAKEGNNVQSGLNKTSASQVVAAKLVVANNTRFQQAQLARRINSELRRQQARDRARARVEAENQQQQDGANNTRSGLSGSGLLNSGKPLPLDPFLKTDGVVDNTEQVKQGRSGAGLDKQSSSIAYANAFNELTRSAAQAGMNGLSALYNGSKAFVSSVTSNTLTNSGMANSSSTETRTFGSSGKTGALTVSNRGSVVQQSNQKQERQYELLSASTIFSGQSDMQQEEIAFMSSLAEKPLKPEQKSARSKLASLQSASDIDLCAIFAFRDGATQKTARRKFAVFRGFSLLSQMIAFWIILREAHDHMLAELEKNGGGGIIPPSLDLGDFLKEFVEVYEQAQQMCVGMPPEEARIISEIGESIDFPSLKQKANEVMALFDDTLGGALEFDSHERPRYTEIGGTTGR